MQPDAPSVCVCRLCSKKVHAAPLLACSSVITSLVLFFSVQTNAQYGANLVLLTQIEYLVDGRLPDDLSAGLVFSNNQLARLRRRVDVSVSFPLPVICSIIKRRPLRTSLMGHTVAGAEPQLCDISCCVGAAAPIGDIRGGGSSQLPYCAHSLSLIHALCPVCLAGHQELEEEKAALRARHKGLRREHAALLRDKAAKEARVAELERRAHDVQMLKFGQVCLVCVGMFHLVRL